jgi:hypothetical protein
MRLSSIFLFAIIATTASGFLPLSKPSATYYTHQLAVTNEKDLFLFSKEKDPKLDEDTKLEWIAQHLKLECYDPDTSVYGFESKDYKYGIETVRASLPIAPSLGLDLTELAGHTHKNDVRGLVLVSKVFGNAAASGRIQPGDTIIGVFVKGEGGGTAFKESTTAMNLEETMHLLQQAKNYATDSGLGSIDLELNRLVKRGTVRVILEQDWRDGHDELPVATEIEALAGDNLRLLLMHHHQRLYDERTVRIDTLGTGDCAGEGICGTCLVEVLDGMETLNPKGPQETESEFTFFYL